MYIVCYDGGARISPNARSCPPRPYTGRGDGQGPAQGVLPRRLSRTPYGKPLHLELNMDAQKKHCRDCRPNSVVCVGCGDCRLRIQIYICGGRTRSRTILFSRKKRIAYRERFVKSRRAQTSIFCTQKSLFFCG